ncbi:MAG: type ISP restriction/modification enzyme [Candidatus Heimdallarchaeota archaeon]
MMAESASFIKKRTVAILEKEGKGGMIDHLFKKIKNIHVPELSLDSFSDLYAQTLIYFIFSTKLMEQRGFKANQILKITSNTAPFLEELFENLQNPDDSISYLEELEATHLIRIFNDLNIEAIFADSGWEEEGKDPIIHFYELFLKEYNPNQRILRGVFYTPDPVVLFIVRSVDHILRSEFGFSDSFAEKKTSSSQKGNKIPPIQILDPSIGTGTFLKHIIEEIKLAFDTKHRDLSEMQLAEEWSQFSRNHILPRLSGFEIMMAPYAIAHLRLGLLLHETSYNFSEKRPLGIYFRNALQEIEEDITSKEGNEKQQPLIVILGNPPYSVSSQNKGPWIKRLIEPYKRNINEKKVNLDDDFIKFIRYGQWRIDRAGQGILAFITPSTYIDGLTHRVMRKSLLNSFDKIYILDLHGNAMKQERTPDGEKDDNVFDIRQGVCITFFIKTGKSNTCKILHRDLFGDRESKYQFLRNFTIQTTNWTELEPVAPYFFFVPKNLALSQEYHSFFALNQIFRQRSYGIQTKRDKITICFEKKALKSIVSDFIDLPEETLAKKYRLPADGRDWKSSWAKADLSQIGWNPKLVAKIQYRPFDYRYTYYYDKSKSFVAYPRYKSMKHMLVENIGLISMRQVFQNASYNHFGVTNVIIDERTFYSNRGGTYLFPLYIYKDTNVEANFSKDFIKLVESRTNLRFAELADMESTIDPKQLFYYMYAIFHSEHYRRRYAEFLKIDFPRVPVASNKDLFLILCQLGEFLVSLHLMSSEKVNNLISGFEGEGNNVVEVIPPKNKPLLAGEQDHGIIKINRKQFFSNVPQEVWKFCMGGYQVCHKWLRDRKGRKLTDREILHYRSIITVIKHTILVMTKIDEVIAEKSEWLLR